MAQAKYYIVLLCVCLIWGATPACGKLLTDALSPLLLTSLRFLSIAAILFTWLFITKQKKLLRPNKQVLFILIAMGFMGITVHNGLLFTGLHYTTATNTALIESIGPTATTVFAFLFVGERLTKNGWIGIFISCLGALCIVTKGSMDVLLNLKFNVGDILILICELAWSSYVIIGWFIHGRMSTVGVTAWSGLFGAIFCLIVGFFTDSLHFYNYQNTSALVGFAYLTFASGLFAFIGWNWAANGVGASKAGAFIYLVPLTGAFIGVLFLGESIGFAQIFGGLLIISGVIVTVRSKVVNARLKEQEKNVDLLKKFPELTNDIHNKKKSKIESILSFKAMFTNLLSIVKRSQKNTTIKDAKPVNNDPLDTQESDTNIESKESFAKDMKDTVSIDASYSKEESAKVSKNNSIFVDEKKTFTEVKEEQLKDPVVTVIKNYAKINYKTRTSQVAQRGILHRSYLSKKLLIKKLKKTLESK